MGTVWEKIELPTETTVLPAAIAFDNDNTMYVGFMPTKKSDEIPYSWVNGGVYKKEYNEDGEISEWVQILDETNSILKLVYDEKSDRLYICGFNMGLLYYKDNNIYKVDGYEFTNTDNVIIHNDRLYVCSRGNGLWIGKADK